MSRTIRKVAANRKRVLLDRSRSRDDKMKRLEWQSVPVVGDLADIASDVPDIANDVADVEMFYEWREMMNEFEHEMIDKNVRLRARLLDIQVMSRMTKL